MALDALLYYINNNIDFIDYSIIKDIVNCIDEFSPDGIYLTNKNVDTFLLKISTSKVIF